MSSLIVRLATELLELFGEFHFSKSRKFALHDIYKKKVKLDVNRLCVKLHWVSAQTRSLMPAAIKESIMMREIWKWKSSFVWWGTWKGWKKKHSHCLRYFHISPTTRLQQRRLFMPCKSIHPQVENRFVYALGELEWEFNGPSHRRHISIIKQGVMFLSLLRCMLRSRYDFSSPTWLQQKSRRTAEASSEKSPTQIHTQHFHFSTDKAFLSLSLLFRCCFWVSTVARVFMPCGVKNRNESKLPHSTRSQCKPLLISTILERDMALEF